MAKRAGSILLIAATPLFLLTLTLLALARPQPVFAATLTVGIDCATLPACIAAASAGDRIEVPAGTYTVNATINKALTINGAGPATTILDGGGSGRVLDIPIAVPVSLSNLTIQNGDTSGHGGGVYAGAGLTLQHVVIRQNQAANAGGLWVEGPLTITDSTIHQNQCTDVDCAGGGIYARGTTVITATDILSNAAATGGGLLATGPVTLTDVLLQNNQGGGLNGASTLLLVASQVISNSASDGGGLRSGGDVLIIDSTLRENSCYDSGCRGGGLHALAGATISNSLVISNTGGDGGGVWAHGAVLVTGGSFNGNQCLATGCIGGALYSNGTLTSIGTTFRGNSSVSDGGAVGSVGLLTLQASDFSGNQAADSAGAAWAYADLLVTGGQFSDNHCTAMDCLGGAIDAAGHSIIAGAGFSQNSAWFGGGAVAGVTFVISQSTFSGNEVTFNGGGLYATGDSVLDEVDFVNNQATTGGGVFAMDGLIVHGGQFNDNVGSGINSGGALALTGTSFAGNVGQEGAAIRANHTAVITSATFTGNRCSSSACRGGAVSVSIAGTISGTTFLSNTAEFAGGGLWANGGLLVANSEFIGNECELDDCLGGGIYSNSLVQITGTTLISGNLAQGDGGGIYTFAALELTGATLRGNRAGNNGGGAWANGNITAVASQVISNVTVVRGGGLFAAGVVSLQASAVLSNSAAFDGGGIAAQGDLLFADSTLSGNASATLGGGAWVNGAVNLTGGQVSQNQSEGSAGGIAGESSGSVQGTTFRGNTAIGSGGGLSLNGTAVITGALFLENLAGSHGGGLAAANAVITGTTFSGNQAGDTGGGVSAALALNVFNSAFVDNQAGFSGGGARGADVMVHDTSFTENSCIGSPCVGGGLASGQSLAISRSNFTGNSSTGIAGAIYIVGPADIDQTRFIQNEAAISGGATYHDILGMASYENVLFDDNQAAVSGAGLYLNNNAVTNLNHVDLVTRLRHAGEGIWINNGTLNMLNSIVAYHHIGIQNNDTASVTNSVFYGNDTHSVGITLGPGNYWLNPRFVAPGAGNYQISPGSVVIDNAQLTAVTVDVAGQPRPFGEAADIGAYESPYLKDQLSVQVTMAPAGSLLPGQPVTYTIIYGNSGEVPAFDLNLSSELPAELVDIAFSSSQTITPTGTSPYSWALGTLAAEAGGVITLTGRIDPALNAELSISNTVQIYSDNALAEHSVSAAVALPEVAFTVTSATVAETDGQVTLTLSLSNPNPYADITVYYATADGTALAGQDYVAANSSVVLAPGQTQTTIQIVILHNVREEQPETFTVTLVSGGGVLPAGQVTVTVTITDTDLTIYAPLVTRP